MPIIIEVEKIEKCHCPNKPDVDRYGEGTIWECDNRKCRNRYELTSAYSNLTGTGYGKKYWKLIS